ncbi:exonuclease domain-containing protein [Mycetocola reblochoni]|uniref:DNA polymerase III subunit epsilon n=1 Tax=Mycetocola reblochoni REB411 TaxID=1255698 RepID=A0A1R4J5L7_9MICO|nr:exonuclease domain-containing protein [Mycetocola reblochoni]SJN27322.1 DNA polymerase III subunit epsilon [Mycetocola reblochoni REB411]
MNNSDSLPAWASTLGVFDLETTGIDVRSSRIVSAFVGVIGPDGRTVESRSWLADPGVEIPEQASAVHGISTERARAEGRPAAEVVAEIAGALGELFSRGLAVVAYNAPYDFSLLAAETDRYGVPAVTAHPVVDPLVIDKQVDRYRKGKRTLEAAAQCYGVELHDAHDAGADAIAAGRVAQAIARAHHDALELPAPELHLAQQTWFREQSERYQDFVRRTRDPTFTASTGWPVRG